MEPIEHLNRDKLPTKNTILKLLTCVAVICVTATSRAQVPGIPRLSVDFSVSQPTPSMSGLLEGVMVDTPDSLIMPLRPARWRSGLMGPGPDAPQLHPPFFDKMTRSGARVELLLMGAWGVPGRTVNRPWPFEDFAAWEDVVRRTARGTRNARQHVVWDIWNEPDLQGFWRGTFDQFLETYRRAYVVLRQELGADALIAGPSLARYDAVKIRQFLNYCRDNQLEVNVLTWHELNDTQVMTIPARVKEVKELLATNAFGGLRIREIELNEVVGPSATYSPGQILGYLANLESVGVSGAMKGCWNDDVQGVPSDCFNGSMDGLIDPSLKVPRAGWWTYKAYADGVATRVATTHGANFVALGSAASDRSDKAQVLIGYMPIPGTTNAPQNVLLDVKNLRSLPVFSGGGVVRIDVFRIASLGQEPMNEPSFVTVFDEIVGDTLSLTLDPLGPDEVFIVSFSRPK
jgi:hypothetical protein